MTQFSIRKLVKPAILGGAMLSLSACAYGSGSYGDNYVNGLGYACDPYAPFDDWYSCDNSYGYANIGYGGGWYDNFYYPGYGIYVFDNRGSRHTMNNSYRRYWAKKRAEYRSRHSRRDRGDRNWDRRDRDGKRDWDRRDRDRDRDRERDWDRRDDRRQNWTPEERAERRERWQERRQDMTPAQRAERRERWENRRDDRGTNRGERRTERRDRRNDDRSQARPRGNRQGTTVRPQRPTVQRPAAQRPSVQRPARPATQQKQVQRQRAPATRATPSNARREIPRNKVNKD